MLSPPPHEPLLVNGKSHSRGPGTGMLLGHPDWRKKGLLSLQPATAQPMRGRHSSANERPATAQPMRGRHNLANEKPLYFPPPVFSNGLARNSRPHPLPPIKARTSHLLRGGASGFALIGSLRFAGLCSSQINPSFASKITGGSILKVNSAEPLCCFQTLV